MGNQECRAWPVTCLVDDSNKLKIFVSINKGGATTHSAVRAIHLYALAIYTRPALILLICQNKMSITYRDDEIDNGCRVEGDIPSFICKLAINPWPADSNNEVVFLWLHRWPGGGGNKPFLYSVKHIGGRKLYNSNINARIQINQRKRLSAAK